MVVKIGVRLWVVLALVWGHPPNLSLDLKRGEFNPFLQRCFRCRKATFGVSEGNWLNLSNLRALEAVYVERPYDETGIYHGHEGVLAHSGIEETFGWVRCFLRVPFSVVF